MKKTQAKIELVGHYFLVFEQREGEKKPKHQGRLIGQITEDIYLVELYSWITGSVTNRKLASLREMVDWYLYDDHETFIHSADKWGRKAG